MVFLVGGQLDHLVDGGQVSHDTFAASQLRHKLNLVDFLLFREKLVEVSETAIGHLEGERDLVTLSVLLGELRLVGSWTRDLNLAL